MNTQEIISKLSPFEIQLIDDLWEYYMYNVRELNDADVDKVDSDDVGYFRKWLDDNTIEAFRLYMPESDSQLAEINQLNYASLYPITKVTGYKESLIKLRLLNPSKLDFFY